MSQFIGINHLLCTGCRTCEVICSLYHYGECSPERSAIRVTRNEKEGLAEPLPIVCQGCDPAPCMEACPEEAIFQHRNTGTIGIDQEKCTGCGECIEACPIKCIFIDEEKDVATNCDLCGGTPQCVELCHSQCLIPSDSSDEAQKDRIHRLKSMM